MSNAIPVDSMPEYLYKYVSAKRALSCVPEVGDGVLRATQPAALNDPFECHISMLMMEAREAMESPLPMQVRALPEKFMEGMVSEEVLRTEEQRKREENTKFACALTNINPRKKVSASDVDRERQKSGSLFARTLLARQLSGRFGIIAFSECPFHPLMWSHYTTDGSGFVIGYNSEIILGLAEQIGARLVKVVYERDPIPLYEYRAFENLDNIYHLLATKSDHWKYEEEWRLIVELEHTVGIGKVDDLNLPVNLLRIPNEAVVEVFYTERTRKKHIDELNRRLTSKNNRYGGSNSNVGQIGVRKLVMSNYDYRYQESPE